MLLVQLLAALAVLGALAAVVWGGVRIIRWVQRSPRRAAEPLLSGWLGDWLGRCVLDIEPRKESS